MTPLEQEAFEAMESALREAEATLIYVVDNQPDDSWFGCDTLSSVRAALKKAQEVK